MAISFNAPTQLSQVTNTTNSANLRIAGNSAVTQAETNATTDFNQSGSGLLTSVNLIKPEPVVRVDTEGNLESPFIEVTRLSANNKSAASAQTESSAPQAVDSAPKQLLALNEQQVEINNRQEQLEKQERTIENEIDQLRRKELEINRKRFQLRQQNIGNLINLQI